MALSIGVYTAEVHSAIEGRNKKHISAIYIFNFICCEMTTGGEQMRDLKDNRIWF